MTNPRSLFFPWFVLLMTSRTFNTLIHSPWSKITSLFNIYSLIFDRPLGYIFKCWKTGVLIPWGQNVELVYLEKNLKLIMDLRPIQMTFRAVITSYFATSLSVKGQRDFWATRQTQHRLEKQTHPKNVICSLYKRNTCQSTPAYLGIKKIVFLISASPGWTWTMTLSCSCYSSYCVWCCHNKLFAIVCKIHLWWELNSIKTQTYPWGSWLPRTTQNLQHTSDFLFVFVVFNF